MRPVGISGVLADRCGLIGVCGDKGGMEHRVCSGVMAAVEVDARSLEGSLLTLREGVRLKPVSNLYEGRVFDAVQLVEGNGPQGVDVEYFVGVLSRLPNHDIRKAGIDLPAACLPHDLGKLRVTRF